MKKALHIVPWALTFALAAGCSAVAPNASSLDFGSFLQDLSLSADQKSYAVQCVQDLASQFQINSDQTAGELISSGAITTQAVVAGKTDQMQEREQKLKERLKDRLATKRQGMTTVSSEATESVGVVDKTVTMERAGGANTIQRVVVRHYVDGRLARVTTTYDATHRNGMALESTRIKDINEDESYTVDFQSKTTLKDKRTKTVHWVRNGSADGSETAEGTIVRFDGTTVQVSYTKTAEGVIKTKIVGDAEVEVSQDEGTSTLDATVTDPKSGQSKKTKIELPSGDDPVAPSEG